MSVTDLFGGLTDQPFAVIPEQFRSLTAAKHRFLAGQSTDASAVRREVLDSWARSRTSGVEPGLTSAPTVLQAQDLAHARTQSRLLLNAAEPLLSELQVLTSGTKHIVTMCDSEARVLSIHGDTQGWRAAEAINLSPGADWSEAGAGTNAMGLALRTGLPTVILATEHYCVGWEHWSCVAAPVRDQTSGQILGILDISAPYTFLGRHALAAVIASARAMEAGVAQQRLQYQQGLLNQYHEAVGGYPGAAVMVFDESGLLLRATGPFQALLHRGKGQPNPDLARVLSDTFESGRRQADWVRGQDGICEVVCTPIIECEFLLGAIAVVRPGRVTLPEPQSSRRLPGLVGQSAAIVRLTDRALRAAGSEATVLISGETGTGKEVLARAIHQVSTRSGGPFIAVNCGALPPTLAASELFGYVAGAFTGAAVRGQAGLVEAAQGGTLFLDEVGELPLDVQVLLLRLLQDREVVRLGSHKPLHANVRVVAATNRNLEQRVAEGLFRADLFYRLNVVPLHMPPLRDRQEDIPLLVNHYLTAAGVAIETLTPTMTSRLQGYDWPGNVRELFNLLERALVLGEPVDALLPRAELLPARALPESNPERDTILDALTATGGNAAAAARRLQMARSTFYRRLTALGITVERQVW